MCDWKSLPQGSYFYVTRLIGIRYSSNRVVDTETPTESAH